MKACLAPRRGSEHHNHWLGLLAEGLGRHDVPSAWIEPGDAPEGDFVAVWGWREARRYINTLPTLVLECGYLGARTTDWISLGWDGLNGRAQFVNANVPGDRAARWARLLKPCRPFGGGPIVIMGQVAGDCSWNNADPATKYQQMRQMVAGLGQPVLFRPHPITADTGVSLAETLEMASGVVTFSSNSGVDAVLAGVPTIAMDAGSMVFGLVPAKPPFEKIDENQRARWLERLAYCQWSAAEVADGTAWEHIGKGI